MSGVNDGNGGRRTDDLASRMKFLEGLVYQAREEFTEDYRRFEESLAKIGRRTDEGLACQRLVIDELAKTIGSLRTNADKNEVGIRVVWLAIRVGVGVLGAVVAALAWLSDH